MLEIIAAHCKVTVASSLAVRAGLGVWRIQGPFLSAEQTNVMIAHGAATHKMGAHWQGKCEGHAIPSAPPQLSQEEGHFTHCSSYNIGLLGLGHVPAEMIVWNSPCAPFPSPSHAMRKLVLPVDLSATVETFCTCPVHCGSHSPYAADEHLKYGRCS